MSKLALSSKITLACLLLLLVFFAYLKFQQYQSQLAIQKEKQSLIDQEASLNKSNQELAQSLSYVNSPDFEEKVAREQLNLKLNGEQVYNFGTADLQATSTDEVPQSGASNPKKWWNYFMGND